MLDFFPKYIMSRAIIVYVVALVVVTFIFMSNAMSWYFFIFGILEVTCFFYFTNKYTKGWRLFSRRLFIKKLFSTALIIRVVWVLFSYFFYIYMTGEPFEFGTADALHYHYIGQWMLEIDNISDIWHILINYFKGGISDTGYSIYLTFLYKIFGDGVLFPRIIKAFLSAFTCVLVYKLATRNFGESVGRMAAVFCMLMPNLIYYCGLHLKETEMVFLAVAFVERADHAIRSSKFTFSNLILPILLASSLFFFRTVLGAAALFAFFTTVLLSSSRIIKAQKRTVLIVWIVVAIVYFMGGRIATEVEEVWENRNDSQAASMEARSKKEGGNQYVKYLSGAVFAPMIFAIPFPTIVDVGNQKNQQLIHGGNYVKNITAFFTMLALFLLFLKYKTWRNYLLIITFVCSYLVIIALSAFAHSERFHLPALPFALILAAFGVTQMNKKYRKYFDWYTLLIFAIIIGWSWFKLAGRGLV